MKTTRVLFQTATALFGITTLLLTTTAFAQGPGGGGPPGGFGRGPGGFGHGPGRGQRQSAMNVPIDILTTELSLTSDEVTKITAVKTQFAQDRQALMPAPGDPSQGPPDPETMRANMDKVRTLEQTAKAQISAVLTTTQSAALTKLLKVLDALRADGIPSETYEDLKLTDTEKTNLTSLAQTKHDKESAIFQSAQGQGGFDDVRTAMQTLNESTNASALDLLTDAQKAVVSAYKVAHPHSDRGGMHGPPPPFN